MIGTVLLLAALSSVLGVYAAGAQYKQAKAAGRQAHHVGLARESIRRVEGARERRKLIARAQLMGASGGVPVADPVLGQIGSDIDRQTELDVWGIREQTWRERFAARQAIQAAKNQAISGAMSGVSMLAGQGGGFGGSALSGSGSSLGSTYVSGGTNSTRLRGGTDYRTDRYYAGRPY